SADITDIRNRSTMTSRECRVMKSSSSSTALMRLDDIVPPRDLQKDVLEVGLAQVYVRDLRAEAVQVEDDLGDRPLVGLDHYLGLAGEVELQSLRLAVAPHGGLVAGEGQAQLRRRDLLR